MAKSMEPLFTSASAVGTVFFSAIEAPDVKFDASNPTYRLKMFVEPDVGRLIFDKCRSIFRRDYPDAKLNTVFLPLERRQDGSIVLTSESTRKPLVRFPRGVRSIKRWDEVRVTGHLRAYNRPGQSGVNFRMRLVELQS